MFYNHVATGVLDEVKKTLQETNIQADRALKSRLDDIETATNRLNLKFIMIYSTAFIAFIVTFLLAIFLYIPSLDEIQQRRAEINNLQKYNLDLSKCDGQTCVKIMKKQCGYGEKRDYCIIDPK
jgi:hypothetical protein